jgi:hypothetical protein
VTGSTPPPPGIILTFSDTGKYVSPTLPTSDPFALVNAPEKPGATQPSDGFPVSHQDRPDCPAANCRHFLPGYYPTGIQVNNEVAIFDPGIYYLEGDFVSNSCMRQSSDPGDGNGGTAFYFANNSTLAINITPTGAVCSPFDTGVDLANIRCTPTSKMPTNVSAQINGTVLLAPCTGPLGDQLGSRDPDGIQRGILFFQNRSTSAPVIPSWQGGTYQFLLSGSMYFHRCVTSGPDTGTGCDTVDAFNDQFRFGGGSGLDTFFLGNIVTDKLDLTGAQMTIDLNPSAGYWVLKASLLQ